MHKLAINEEFMADMLFDGRKRDGHVCSI